MISQLQAPAQLKLLLDLQRLLKNGSALDFENGIGVGTEAFFFILLKPSGFK